MKVISLLQPWASLVVLGHKQIETRSWNTSHRGPLLIHASAKVFKPTRDHAILLSAIVGAGVFDHQPKKGMGYLPTGAIIGSVNLIETVPFTQYSTGWDLDGRLWDLTEKERVFGDFTPGRFGWLLDKPVAFDVPTPAKGQLGIWNNSGSFICSQCKHELPLEFQMRTPEFCYLCDPEVTVKELLDHKGEKFGPLDRKS